MQDWGVLEDCEAGGKVRGSLTRSAEGLVSGGQHPEREHPPPPERAPQHL